MNQASTNSSAAETSVNLQYLYDLADGSFEFVEEMINLFLATVPPAVDELEQAIASSDWKTVKAIAHRIKPSFGFIGVRRAQDVLNTMEVMADEVPDGRTLLSMYNEISGLLKNCVAELETELQRKGQ